MENYHEQSNLISEADRELLTNAFRSAWSKETAHVSVAGEWSENNKALGQCAVTSLIIQEIYGGGILDDNTHNHMWNLLPDGSQQDFSRCQFTTEVELVPTAVKTRHQVLDSDKAILAKTPERYKLLRGKLGHLIDALSKQ